MPFHLVTIMSHAQTQATFFEAIGQLITSSFLGYTFVYKGPMDVVFVNATEDNPAEGGFTFDALKQSIEADFEELEGLSEIQTFPDEGFNRICAFFKFGTVDHGGAYDYELCVVLVMCDETATARLSIAP